MTSPYIHYIYRQDAKTLAAALAGRITELYEASAARPFVIALSGGSTPRALFDYWREYPALLTGRDYRFWWVDERMVPETSSDSNYGNALRACFGPMGYDLSRLYPIPYDEESSVADAVARYNDRLEGFMTEYRRTAPFDLVILGVGEDGHTSSLFPNQPFFDIPALYLRSVHPTNGVERVALSYAGIARSPKVIFHVTGQGKRERLAEVIALAERSDTEAQRLPAAYAMRLTPQPEIYTDIPR